MELLQQAKSEYFNMYTLIIYLYLKGWQPLILWLKYITTYSVGIMSDLYSFLKMLLVMVESADYIMVMSQRSKNE